MRGLLSEFALGPAWARAGSGPPSLKPRAAPEPKGGEREPRRGEQDRGFRERDERRPSQGRRENYGERRTGPPQPEESGPAEGVRVSLTPDPQAIHLIGREVHQVARVYPLFDIARILLAERGRCRAVFELEADHPPLFCGKLDESLFLTRDEAIRHLWHSDLSQQLIEEETIEVDPPSGRFQAVARCGLSGAWLGPPNHHSYQTNLRRLHRERFSNMPFEVYASKVRTERSEEAVAAWLETMKQKVRWRIKGGDENAWIDDRAEAERAVATRCFEAVYAEVRTAEISGAILPNNISPALLTSLRMVGSHARQHPAILIPAVCRALEAEHLPVFKRLGKLHTGPARPHALDPDIVLAERPAAMVEWIRNNSPAKLAGLWQAVLPEGLAEPTPDYAADLFWLLHQGHILLYADDKLAMQEPREATPPKTTKKTKTPKPPRTDETAQTGESSDDDPPAVEETVSEEAVAEEAADEETGVDEITVGEAGVEEAGVEEAAAEDAGVGEASIELGEVDEASVEAAAEVPSVGHAAVAEAKVAEAALGEPIVAEPTVEVPQVTAADTPVSEVQIATADDVREATPELAPPVETPAATPVSDPASEVPATPPTPMPAASTVAIAPAPIAPDEPKIPPP